jgi:hypothetical protein
MSETIVVDTGKIDEEEKQTAVMVVESLAIEIKNQQQYISASEFLKKVKGKIKDLDTLRKQITKPIDSAKQNVMDLFRSPLTKLKEAETSVKRLMITYSEEQEKKQREIQAKLRREADEKARKERERLEARAKKAEETGKEEKAEALREQAEEVVAEEAVVVAAPEKPKGVSYRDKYTAEVVNIKELPREYMIANQPALDKIAQATKGTIAITGVKFHKEKVMSSRTG